MDSAHRTYSIRALIILLMGLVSVTTAMAQDSAAPLTGRHQIAYHYGTLITGKEDGFVHLYRKRTIPVVSIDYSFHFDRHWAIGADAAVYLPNEYRIMVPEGYSMIEDGESNRNITVGSFMLTGSYSAPLGPVELTGSLGVGFSEFTSKGDKFYLMDDATEATHTLQIKHQTGFYMTLAPMLRVSRPLSRTLSIFLEGRYNILMGHSSLRLSYMPDAAEDATDRRAELVNRRIHVRLPNSFSLTFGFTLRFGTIK